MEFKPTNGVVTSEECDLHYWYQGSGPLITFVPGGNGHGRQYNAIIAALSDRFTCCTFDRRQMSASKVKGTNKILSFPQQARDILAVIKALGFDKSILFCSSLGGIIGFQFAIDHPEAVNHLICHETPTVSLLDDASSLIDYVLGLLNGYRETGDIVAASQGFALLFRGIYGDDLEEGVPPTAAPEPWNAVNFWDNEVISSFYVPDFRKIVARKVSIGVMNGESSRDAFYARAVYEQEKVLGCVRMLVPGHHQNFEVQVDKFVPALLQMLGKLEERRQAAA
ncbi:Acetyltransferase/esterase [Pleurostoma richardsiae]|uniref:Acetyltransferase/esterase n=1 Tax=Pleurostoma richardsiae TaxID=41990 RepID=A0AA38VC60_9PEZI|nr:Acetyltransferase/esterase [Pleurostoma richardsiae]